MSRQTISISLTSNFSENLSVEITCCLICQLFAVPWSESWVHQIEWYSV